MFITFSVDRFWPALNITSNLFCYFILCFMRFWAFKKIILKKGFLFLSGSGGPPPPISGLTTKNTIFPLFEKKCKLILSKKSFIRKKNSQRNRGPRAPLQFSGILITNYVAILVQKLLGYIDSLNWIECTLQVL